MQIPRYVRVNTLKTTTDEVITWFTKNGFELERRKDDSLDSFQVRQFGLLVTQNSVVLLGCKCELLLLV
jgi:16S rRNA C967 or C1407 C5-methylase (RsmB/RsmF family)